MPTYLLSAAVDWRMDERPLEDRVALLGLAKPLSEADDHTLESMIGVLAMFSKKLSSPIEAALRDEMLTDVLVKADRGRIAKAVFEYASPVDGHVLSEDDARRRVYVPMDAFRALDVQLRELQIYLQNESDVRIAHGAVEIDLPFDRFEPDKVEAAMRAIAAVRIVDGFPDPVCTMIDLRGERQVVLFEKRRARVLPARPRVASKPGDEAHARFVEIFRRDTDLLSDVFDGKVPFALPASLAARLAEIREAGQATSSWLTALWQRQRTGLEAVARGEIEAALEPLAAEDRVKYMAVVDPSIKLLLGNAAERAGVKVSQLVAFAALADGGGPSALHAPRDGRAGARPSRRSKRSSRRRPHGRCRARAHGRRIRV